MIKNNKEECSIVFKPCCACYHRKIRFEIGFIVDYDPDILYKILYEEGCEIDSDDLIDQSVVSRIHNGYHNIDNFLKSERILLFTLDQTDQFDV